MPHTMILFDSTEVARRYEPRGEYARMAGASLAAAREALGISQDELAEALDVNRTSVIRWEQGDMLPRFPKMVQIAHTLKTPLGVVFAHPDLQTLFRDCEHDEAEAA